MEFKGTREKKVNELKAKIKGEPTYVDGKLIDATSEISIEEMHFLMLDNSRQQLVISKVFLWTFIIIPVVGTLLYTLLES
jgi:hypothetical protein